MKKNLILVTVGLLLVLLFNQKGFSQSVAFEKGLISKSSLYSIARMYDTSSLNNPASVSNYVNNSSSSVNLANMSAKEIKGFNRAAKAFGKDFKGAENAKWNRDGSGFSTSFMKDGVHNLAFYNAGGGLVSFMRSYTEEKLPNDIKSIVSDNYDAYSISGVDEIHKDDILVYLVHLETDKKIKLITICNGEINVYKDLSKGK